MKHQLFFNQSEKSKFYGSLLIYCKAVNEIFIDSENQNKTPMEKQQMIKTYIETYYKREWDGVNRGDFSYLIKSNILDNNK